MKYYFWKMMFKKIYKTHKNTKKINKIIKKIIHRFSLKKQTQMHHPPRQDRASSNNRK